MQNPEAAEPVQEIEVVYVEGKYSFGTITRIGKPSEENLRNVLELIKAAGEMQLRDKALRPAANPEELPKAS